MTEQTEAHRVPKSLAFEIVSYDDAEGSDEITVKRPDEAPAERVVSRSPGPV